MADALGRPGGHPGAVLGVARFYHDPRSSMRGVLASRPSEGRLFAYALGAVSMLLVGRVLALVATPDRLTADLAGQVAALATALLFFVPLAWYALAALGTAAARACRGTGRWREGRTAFFWAALVSAPVMVITGLVPLTVPEAPRIALAMIAQIGPVFFAWALAQCYAEAFGFRRARVVFAVIAAIVAVVLGLAWWVWI